MRSAAVFWQPQTEDASEKRKPNTATHSWSLFLLLTGRVFGQKFQTLWRHCLFVFSRFLSVVRSRENGHCRWLQFSSLCDFHSHLEATHAHLSGGFGLGWQRMEVQIVRKSWSVRLGSHYERQIMARSGRVTRPTLSRDRGLFISSGKNFVIVCLRHSSSAWFSAFRAGRKGCFFWQSMVVVGFRNWELFFQTLIERATEVFLRTNLWEGECARSSSISCFWTLIHKWWGLFLLTINFNANLDLSRRLIWILQSAASTMIKSCSAKTHRYIQLLFCNTAKNRFVLLCNKGHNWILSCLPASPLLLFHMLRKPAKKFVHLDRCDAEVTRRRDRRLSEIRLYSYMCHWIFHHFRLIALPYFRGQSRSIRESSDYFSVSIAIRPPAIQLFP
jgi:hypothetical protein